MWGALQKVVQEKPPEQKGDEGDLLAFVCQDLSSVEKPTELGMLHV